jgi:hypothetical protein
MQQANNVGSVMDNRRGSLPASDRSRGLDRGSTHTKWYKLVGIGMWRDVRNRMQYYRSDWTDAWNYRVIPATLVNLLALSRRGCIEKHCN